MKFLLVEDDRALANAIKQLLANHYYLMNLATDGIIAQEMADAFSYDLILLDWPQMGLYRVADEALSKAKAAGRNQVCSTSEQVSR